MLKDTRIFLVTSEDMVHFNKITVYVAHSDKVCPTNLNDIEIHLPRLHR